jgi:hypothetical protein
MVFKKITETQRRNAECAEFALKKVVERFPYGSLNIESTYKQLLPLTYTLQLTVFSLLRNEPQYVNVLLNGLRGGFCPLENQAQRIPLLISVLRGGFCGELALFAIHFINEEFKDVKAESVMLAGGDHQMVVIGRKDGSDPKKIETWGGDAVILDPWAKKVYFAKDFYEVQKVRDEIPWINTVTKERFTSYYLEGTPEIYQLKPS